MGVLKIYPLSLLVVLDRVRPDTSLAEFPDTRYPALEKSRISGIRPYIWPTFDIRKITGYPALEISRVSGIRIVSISGIRPDIENDQISGQTGFPAQP